MSSIQTPINGHPTLSEFIWGLNLLVQKQTGTESAMTYGDGAEHNQVSLDYIRSLLVEVANIANNLTTTTAGKVLDARQGKALKDLIDAIISDLSDLAGDGHTDETVKANADAISALLSSRGVADGLATLAGDGKVPSSQLPSYVDDVIEVADYASLPATGETGKIYVTLDTSKTYRWSGSAYVELTDDNALWGQIAGTLANQADLVAALALKETVANVNALKGAGYVDETVKGNADAIGALGSRVTAEEEASTNHESRIEDLEDKASAISYYGLRRRSDGVYTRTGAAATMTPARSNGTYNPTVSDFMKVRPWSDIRLCLMDKIGNIVAIQGDDNFATYAAETNPDGTNVWNFGSLFTPFYMRIWEGVDGESYAFKEWDVSAVKLPGYNIAPAFVREDGTIRPYIVINSFKTGMDTDGKVCSKPNTVPLVNTSTLSFDSLYEALDVDTTWLGNHFVTNDVWKILVCIEFGTMDIQNAVGQGISSSMPYPSSSSYQLTEATTDSNAVTIADSGQPFYAGMDVQIGSSYANNTYAANRKITDVDTVSVPGSMIITVDGDPFSAPIGSWIVTWGQSDSVDNLLQIGTGCGWISQWGAESRSHVYIYGLVDPYSNVFEVERGKMRKAKHFWINFDPLTSSGIADPEASGYTDCGEFSTGASSYGWISDFKIVTLGLRQMQLVSEVGGNSIGDVIYYADDTRTGTYVCFRGGNWLSGSYEGPFYEFWRYSPSYASISRGDRGIILEPAMQAA